MEVIDRVPSVRSHAAALRRRMEDERVRARAFTRLEGDDLAAVRDWVWPHA